MIVKKIKRDKSNKPKAWQIGDLVDYIRNPQTANAHEKIAHAGGRNFLSGTHNGQKAEMIALAQESVHSAMPVSHWVFSFKENEQPSRQQVDELVGMFLEHMGLQEHQAVYGLLLFRGQLFVKCQVIFYPAAEKRAVRNGMNAGKSI